jgi:hypothetical protein
MKRIINDRTGKVLVEEKTKTEKLNAHQNPNQRNNPKIDQSLYQINHINRIKFSINILRIYI